MVGYGMKRAILRSGLGRPGLTLAATVLTGIVLAGIALPAPAAAQSADLVARWNGTVPGGRTIAAVLAPEDRSQYRQLFAAIDAEQWEVVESLLAQNPSGVLTQAARAEYYTHADSPTVGY